MTKENLHRIRLIMNRISDLRPCFHFRNPDDMPGQAYLYVADPIEEGAQVVHFRRSHYWNGCEQQTEGSFLLPIEFFNSQWLDALKPSSGATQKGKGSAGISKGAYGGQAVAAPP